MKLSGELKTRVTCKEVWCAVAGFEGYYDVSNLGRVRSRDRQIGKRLVKGKLLKPGYYPNKYLFVCLRKEGVVKNAMVHRLVAAAFLEKTDNCNVVNHKDGDKQNNCVENLEWCTPSENQLHSACVGLRKTHFSKQDKETMKCLYEKGLSQGKIAEKFGVSQVLVSLALRGKLNYLEDKSDDRLSRV